MTSNYSPEKSITINNTMPSLHFNGSIILVVVIFCHCFLLGYCADCSQIVGCANCTIAAGCGWCSATQTCLEGNHEGPYNVSCLGSWRIPGSTCVDCTSQLTCRGCSSNADCAWCEDKCLSGLLVGTISCPIFSGPTCPCNEYASCHECAKVPGCAFCETGTCEPSTSSFCKQVTCDCGNYPTCTTCSNDPSCGWCYGTDNCTSLPAQCSLSLGCDADCNMELGCLECTGKRGCGWCPSREVCHSIDSTVCSGSPMLTQCPKKCEAIADCNLCIDMGLPCEWCTASRSCVDIGTSNCTNTIDNCAVEICQHIDDCSSCYSTPGCAWCERKGGYCTDIFSETDCDLQHGCGPHLFSNFSVGSFFGGMATMLGVYIVISILALIYKRKFPPKKYEEIKDHQAQL